MFGQDPFGAGTNSPFEAIPDLFYTGYGPPIESRDMITSEIQKHTDDWGRINSSFSGEAALYGESAQQPGQLPVMPDSQVMIERLANYLFNIARGRMEAQNAGNEICGLASEDQERMFREILRESI